MLLAALDSAVVFSPGPVRHESDRAVLQGERDEHGLDQLRPERHNRDRAEISDRARAASSRSAKPEAGTASEEGQEDEGAAPARDTEAIGRGQKPNGEPLTEEEAKRVDDLKQRDREVRAHEQAHKNAAGPYAVGGPQYEFEKGPDGHRYAVGGSVNIDTSPIPGDPQATIQKMNVVRRAALAPAEPSSQDRQVAAQASRAIAQAQQEMREAKSSTDQPSGAAADPASAAKPAATGAQPTSPEATQSSRRHILSETAARTYRQAESITDPSAATLVDLVG